MSDTKKCTKCGEEKPATLEFYHRDKNKKGGLHYDCKECKKLYYENNKEKFKEYYKNNKEEILEQRKLYRKNNKEEILEQRKLYYENNKEEILEQKKLYYENNKEKILEREKLYRENNKEKILEKNKLYRKNNKEKIKERGKLYYENNKEKIKEYYENNKEKILEREKLYRKNNKEKIKEYYENNKEKFKEYYENNKEEILEQRKLYRENNKQNNSYGIYKITHKETGKIYIGETIDFARRAKDHKRKLKGQYHDNRPLQETFYNGGQDFDEIFKFEILEEWDIERKQEFDLEKGKQCPKYKLLKEELRKREAEVIEEYIQQGHDLYNIAIDVETYAALMAEMREYLEAAGE